MINISIILIVLAGINLIKASKSLDPRHAGGGDLRSSQA